MPGRVFFSEDEIFETLRPGLRLPSGPVFRGNARIPGEGLEFRLACQRTPDKSAEFLARDVLLDGVKGSDRMEHFHGTNELTPENLHAVFGTLLQCL